ncbi:hypothetical protein [Umezawaea sp. Da 62-37]|uniref:hypothetical protein n=1 Tax=Umezawaea sp. Da 62-37 TaxID=3075927 RepID=UPI0028F74066|nr:hypothetical protein [Umezawaea sp. Da 62-37]WNV86183.1 hypothetical protein RM788_50085 [Umezawaea sp. Da 62-37]
MGARQLRPLDEYDSTTDDDFRPDPDSPYSSYYVVLPEGTWEPEEVFDEEPDDDHLPDDSAGRSRAGGVAGIATALVAGMIPALVLDLPAALAAGLAAGVFGGLMGRSLGVEFHDRGHRGEEG